MSTDAYVMVEWETSDATGHAITLADRIEQEIANAGKQRHILRVSTFFVAKGTDFEKVCDLFSDHYDATFDERANETLDRMLGMLDRTTAHALAKLDDAPEGT